jgi:hypothetical protein
MVVAGCAYGYGTWGRHRGQATYYHHLGDKTWKLIEQVRTLPAPPPPSRVVFVNDPFPEGHDTEFVARFVWNDRSSTIKLQHKARLTNEELSQMDAVYEFSDGRVKRVKP